MLNDFKAFVVRGNVVDLAVGIVMGASFGAIVTSLGQSYPTLAAARAAGVPTLNYGVFLNTVINLPIVSFAIIVVMRHVDRLYFQAASARAGTQEWLYCTTTTTTPAPR